MYNVGMEKKTTTSILEVKGISFAIVMIYRELWGDLDLEDVQEIYKRGGLDKKQLQSTGVIK